MALGAAFGAGLGLALSAAGAPVDPSTRLGFTGDDTGVAHVPMAAAVTSGGSTTRASWADVSSTGQAPVWGLVEADAVVLAYSSADFLDCTCLRTP